MKFNIKFKLWHSLLGLSLLLTVEGFLIQALSMNLGVWAICAFSVLGMVINTYVAMEVIEDVHSLRHMLAMLSAIVGEFILFFGFQYWYLLFVDPASFPTLHPDALSLLLHSVMVFVFNPLNTPGDIAGQALLLINILGALVLVMFIFQNISQLRHKLPTN